MKKLKRLQKRLTSAGYDVKIITLSNINNTGASAPVLCVDTDYDGMFPTRETFDKIGDIKKIAKDHKIECRGYYTAVFIY